MPISLFHSVQNAITVALNNGTASVESKHQFMGFLFDHNDEHSTPAVLSMAPLAHSASQSRLVQWLPALICMDPEISLRACAWACVEKDARGRPGCTIVIATPSQAPESKWYPITQGKEGIVLSSLASRDATVPAHCNWFSVLELPQQEYAYLTFGTPFHKRPACEPFFSALATRLGLIVEPGLVSSATEAAALNTSTMQWFNFAMLLSQRIQIGIFTVWNQKLRKEISMIEGMSISFDTSEDGATIH